MRRAPESNDSMPAEAKGSRGFARWHILVALFVFSCLAAALMLYARERNPSPQSPTVASTVVPKIEVPAKPTKSQRESHVAYAAWYDVPPASLAKRRAGLHELTAAHNKLPLGTLIRVTHLENGKSVIVRITDRGIRDRKVNLDVCKEAAVELDMVSQGFARVRIEVIPEEQGGSPPESHTAAPQP